MRLARPVLMLVLLTSVTTVTQSQEAGPPGTGGINLLMWGMGFPKATTGGVDLAVSITPTTGYSCTELKFQVVDDKTAKVLDEHTIMNPGANASKSFNGYANNLKLRVYAYAIFSNGMNLDAKDLEGMVTTK